MEVATAAGWDFGKKNVINSQTLSQRKHSKFEFWPRAKEGMKSDIPVLFLYYIIYTGFDVLVHWEWQMCRSSRYKMIFFEC